jgi:hypothetical protein
LRALAAFNFPSNLVFRTNLGERCMSSVQLHKG